MNGRALALAASAALCGTLFAFAFVAAPKSCEWGLGAYVWSGVACLLLLVALPFGLRVGHSILSRTGLSAGFALGGALVWVAGLFAANVRIICRLF